MNIKYIITIISLSFFSYSVIYAQPAKKNTGLKSGAAYIKLLESYSQRILPGVRGIQPTTEFHFILVWKNKEVPTTFFWRGEQTWMTCNIAKVRKNKQVNEDRNMPDADYTREDITKNPIKKGDTLEITPIKGGKFAIPKEIPQTASNTLYFKTTKSNWLSFPVKKITAKQDIAMP